MPEPHSRRGLHALVLVAALTACGAPPPPPATPAPPAVTDAEVDAAARLLQLEDRREYEPSALDSAAASPSPFVRRHAARAFGRLRDRRGLPVLERLLRDADTTVAATAAFALGQVGDTTAVADLARALRGPAVSVAAEAGYALGKLGSRAAGDTLLAFLASVGPGPGIEPVASALLAAWRAPRPADVSALLRWAGAPDPELRWRAAYALTRRPDPRATSTLLPLARDPDARVRAMALRGLSAAMVDSASLARDSVVALLVAELADSDYQASINAARTLGSYDAGRAVEALAAAARAGAPHLRVAAMESLGRVGSAARPAAALLRAIALDAGEQIFLRQEALEALAHVDRTLAAPAAAGLAGDSRWRIRASAARALATASGPADAGLLGLVRDPDGRVSAAALDAALQAAGDSARALRGVLVERLASPDVFVRSTALGGLQRLADPSTLPLLLDAYARARRDTLDDAALAAVDAIAAARQPASSPAAAFFNRFSRSPDPLVRLRVARAFGDDAARAWGPPLPVETGRSFADYRGLVERSVHGPDPEVEIVTDSGTIRLRLFAGDAPTTVESFLALAARGYFHGQEWPRVVPNFVVQGGDPRGDTNGGPGYTLRDEINRHRYGTGTLGMALSGPDTGGSQFFVTHSPQPHLDGTYAVFGEVVQGESVTHSILPGDRIQQVHRIP